MTSALLWSTYVFALPGQQRGPIAVGTGVTRQAAAGDALERMRRRLSIPHGVDLQQLAERLEAEHAQLRRHQREAAVWCAGTAVADCPGHPQVVYHGTSSHFEVFNTDPRRGFGAHFGTVAQALERASRPQGRLLAANRSIRNPVRLRDCGSWEAFDVAGQLRMRGLIDAALFARVAAWSESGERDGWNPYHELRQALAVRGIDGVVYLNRGEALSGDVEWDDSTDDNAFCALVPGAQDSWIVFEPTQIRLVQPCDPIDERAMHRAITRVAAGKELWAILLGSSAAAGPREGGSLIAAEALIMAAGRGELVHAVRLGAGVQRYGARIDGVIYDMTGSAAGAQEWIDRIIVEASASHLGDSFVFGTSRHASCTMHRDTAASAAIAQMVGAAYGGIPQRFEVAPPAARPHAQVVHQRSGRYRGVLSVFASEETRATAAFLAQDARIRDRLRAGRAEGDVYRTWALCHVVAAAYSRAAGLDPAFVDWSDVARVLARPGMFSAERALPEPDAPEYCVPAASSCVPDGDDAQGNADLSVRQRA